MTFNLRPGAKIGMNPVTEELPDPKENGYGTLGCFLAQANSDDLFILTNGHVVDWKMGQEVYLYEEFDDGFQSQRIGEVVTVSTNPDDVENGIDAAVIKVDNADDWNIDYKVDGVELIGTEEAEDGMKVRILGARSEANIEAIVRDTNDSFTIKGIDAKNLIRLGYKGRENEPGDSGSVLVNATTGNVVGLFFSEHVAALQNGYACHIQKVLDLLSKGVEEFTIKGQ